jgi:hypothetical protein
MLASLACWKASLEIKQVYWSCGRAQGLKHGNVSWSTTLFSSSGYGTL